MNQLAAIAFVLISTMSSMAQGIFLSAGQSVNFTFNTMTVLGPEIPPGPGEPNILYFAGFTWADGSFLDGSAVTLSAFETSTTDTSFKTGNFQGSTVSSANNDGFLGLSPGGAVPQWQDMQGAVSLEVTAGSIVLQRIDVNTTINGIIYQTALVTPEPDSRSLFGMAGLLVLLKVVQRKK